MIAIQCPRLIFLSVLFLLSGCLVFSQNKKEAFSIPPVEQKISGSHYNQIELIDARADTVNMGFVQVGMFNSQANIFFKTPFRWQLSKLMSECTDATAKKDTLYFQLRKLSFSEITGSFSEAGLFNFRATLYRKFNDRFIRIKYADTVLQNKAGAVGDVTKTLLKGAGVEIIEFVKQSLQLDGEEENSYSLAEIGNPDSVEKSKIALFTTDHYTNGLYNTYQSFAAQTPDQQMIVEEKNGKIKSVKIMDSTGKQVKVKSKDFYGMVYQGKPYAATSRDFYPLTKENGDFYFIGKVKAGADPMAGVAFGLMGSLLSSTSYYTYEMKIDHVSGGFIRIRYIPDPGY